MPLFRSSLDAAPNRSLVACAPIPPYTPLFTERPLHFLQTLPNSRLNPTCTNCNAFLRPETGFHCRHNCGHRFCSEACEAAANSSAHIFLCTGPIPDDNGVNGHPLIQLKIMSATDNEIFLACASISCKALAGVIEDVASGMEAEAALKERTNNMTCFCRETWWDVRASAMSSSSSSNEEVKEMCDALHGMCEAASSLMLEAAKMRTASLGLEWPECCDALFTTEFWGRTVGTFEQNAIGCRLRNDLVDSIRDGLGDDGLELLKREGEVRAPCILERIE